GPDDPSLQGTRPRPVLRRPARLLPERRARSARLVGDAAARRGARRRAARVARLGAARRAADHDAARVRERRDPLRALPGAAAPALLAGRRLAAIAERRPRPAAAVALLAAAPPLAASAQYVRQTARPNTMDAALDAVAARVPAGARVLTGIPGLGLDRERLEV